MEFTNEFTVPLDIDRALDVLSDLERVAPCFPGATLESVDGDTYSGRVKVKVGPMSLTYTGEATVTEVDHDAHTARIEAAGREKRGAGTATADVRAELREQDGATVVVVTTDLDVTGRPAQFGRGVMADVGAKIIDRFADNLHAQLDEEQGGDGAAGEGDEEAAGADDEDGAADDEDGGAGEEADATDEADGQSSGPRPVTPVAPRDEALDLMDVAGPAAAKRLVPVAVAAAVLLVLWLVLRRRGEE